MSLLNDLADQTKTSQQVLSSVNKDSVLQKQDISKRDTATAVTAASSAGFSFI